MYSFPGTETCKIIHPPWQSCGSVHYSLKCHNAQIHKILWHPQKNTQGNCQKNVQLLGRKHYKDDVSSFESSRIQSETNTCHSPLTPRYSIYNSTLDLKSPGHRSRAHPPTAAIRVPRFLLSPGRRVQSLWGRISRVKDTFVHQAARMLNPRPALPLPLPFLPHMLWGQQKKNAKGINTACVLHDDDAPDLAIIRSSLPVPAWAWGDWQTFPAFLLLE